MDISSLTSSISILWLRFSKRVEIILSLMLFNDLVMYFDNTNAITTAINNTKEYANDKRIKNSFNFQYSGDWLYQIIHLKPLPADIFVWCLKLMLPETFLKAIHQGHKCLVEASAHQQFYKSRP